jgi:uncharacterized protein involved in exopolysaccharide biosynthesis
VLIGAVVAFAWASRQPVRYEGMVRVFLDTEGDQTANPGRIVCSQAKYLTSPRVLERAVALTGGRLTRKQLEERLTVEPANDADLITIRVLGATPQGAARLADMVVSVYRQVVAGQANEAAEQAVAALTRRQQRLKGEIIALNEQLRAQLQNPRLLADRDAKTRQLNALADQREAAIPDEPAQSKPPRTAAIGALLAFVAAAALAWLCGRQLSFERQRPSLGTLGGSREGAVGLDLSSPLRLAARFRNGQAVSTNGSPAGDGSVSGIADFDQIATSVQELFRFLDGPPQRLYEGTFPSRRRRRSNTGSRSIWPPSCSTTPARTRR